MIRPLRIEYPNAWYHVMNRGRRGEDIFSGKKDAKIFTALLQEAAELWDVRISAYCLMGNHYHLLIQTPQSNLSRFMRHINGVYTQRYNRLHGHDGQLFRGRFKSILVEEDSYLLELVRYIHRNPLRAGMVEKISEHEWSSHIGYTSSAKKWTWLYKDFILAMLSSEIGNGRRAYKKFMAEEDSEEISDLFEKKKWPALLGSEDFVGWVKKTFLEEKKHPQVPESGRLAPELDQIKKAVCAAYGVDEKALLATQRGKSNEPRSVAIYLGRILRKDSLPALGKAFGMTGYSPAGSAIERVRKKLPKDKQLQKRIKQISKTLFSI
jgi:putative transposase